MRDGGDLVLGHRLGSGGAATIFAARWRGREVSAKVAHAVGCDEAGDLAVEADVLSRVSHAALLGVLASGELADGRPYLVLPLLRGEDLAARLRRGPLPVAQALEVIARVGGALMALHAAGVVHRDLKPENVFLGEDGVFLLDLGLARNIASGTASWRIRGTYDVMAPERLYGEPAGVTSEVYELATLAWAALTGALPWPAGAPPSARRGIPPLALERHRSGHHPRDRGDGHRNGDADRDGSGDGSGDGDASAALSAALDAVLRGALSTVPERRPSSVAALVAALHEAARDPGPVAARRTAELGARGIPTAAAMSRAAMSRAVMSRADMSHAVMSRADTSHALMSFDDTSHALMSHDDMSSAGVSFARPPIAGISATASAIPSDGSIIAESYRLLGVLGSGGAGTVFAAEHLRLPRRLAIKILRPDRGDHDARARFQREAEIIASLSHPHIVEVFDYDVDECGAPFMVMERLEGETLRDRLARGRLAVAEVVELVRQVASGVAAAHARGVVHRDLKPSNLFLRHTASSALDVKVLDFGISKVLGNPIDDTTSGLALGSPGYAAPEQSRGDGSSIGPTTDVFALAAIAYEALSGRRAFEAPTRDAVLQRILHDDPDPLRVPGVSRAIDRIVRAGLAKRPERRPPSIEAFAAALAVAATDRAAPRRRRQIAVGGSVISALAAALVIAATAGDGAPSTATGSAGDGTHSTATVSAGDGAPSTATVSAGDGTPSTAMVASAARTSAPIDPARNLRSVNEPVADATATAGALRSANGAEPATEPPSAAQPPARSLRVVVQPSHARVSIDGALVTTANIALRPGSHDLRATAPGYQALARSIDAAALADVLTVRLTRADRRADKTEARKQAESRGSEASSMRKQDPARRPELPSLRSLLEQ